MIKELLPLLVLSTTSATTVVVTPSDALVVAQGLDDIVSLDPAEASELSNTQTIPSLCQRVVQPDRNDPTGITPILAESWQADSAVKTLTIKLKSNTKFTSNSPVRPEDVIYSYVQAVILNESDAFILNMLGWQPKNIASQSRKIGDHTIQVQWSTDISLALALNTLSAPIASIADEKLVAPNVKDNDSGNKWLKMYSADSGAFKMCTYQPHQATVMETNTSSPTGVPKLKNVITESVPGPATCRLLVQRGDAGMAHDLGADQIDALQGKPGVEAMSITSAEQNYLALNTSNKDNPLVSNPAFWETARRLVDYDGITRSLLKGQYFTHQSLLSVGFPGALEEIPPTFDPTKAKEILTKAGTKSPHFMLDVENKPPFIIITQSIQASFAQGDIKVDLLSAAGSRVYSRARAHQHQGAIRMWLPDHFDVHSNASSFTYNDGKSGTVAGLNGWEVPELNKETPAAITESDNIKRLNLHKKT